MRLLDLYCCQGGASKGYADAGFDVVGVDCYAQPRYPYKFVQADAIHYLRNHAADFDAVHASPPCQAYSEAQRIQDRDHPDLIADTRAALIETGLPYVIENVMGARRELRNPIMLCGTMFPALRVYRHRLFESNFPVAQPSHPEHRHPQVKMGRPPTDGQWVQAVGNFSGVAEAREAMELPWMSREGLREALPPAYTEYMGRALRAHLSRSEPLPAINPSPVSDCAAGTTEGLRIRQEA